MFHDNPTNEELRATLARGDVNKARSLIDAGADIHYRADHGYDAIIDSVHGRDVLHDTQLIELITLLIESGVSLTGMSTYGESGVRVLSRVGRFDAVHLLLRAGANPDDLEFTPLIEAVAFGSTEDIEAVISSGVDLEKRDRWERTAWLIAIQMGDIPKAKLLLKHGSQHIVRGRCGKPPLFFAIENCHTPMLNWLLEIGADIHETDEFGGTPLAVAAEYNNLEAVNILLKSGVDVNEQFSTGPALRKAETREVAIRLLQAGADPLKLSTEGRRAILGYSPDPCPDMLDATMFEFRKYRSTRFGKQNPEKMNNRFWEGMIRSGLNAYQAGVHFEKEHRYDRNQRPIWCAQRFGQSITFLEDGRIVQVAGEHEDAYDADFCIYNDVFVHDPAGNIIIYGYPKSAFPPTDFHTATLVGKYIYLIGSLGYKGTRKYGKTPVYRLDTDTFQIERLDTTGDNPGWIYKHQAIQFAVNEIHVSGGKIVTEEARTERHTDIPTRFVLDITNFTWHAGV